MSAPTVAVIGGGPAGLMAAEVLSAAGARVTVYERMPSVGRKLLMAGRGGLNLTHSEGFEEFVARYGEAATWLRPILEAFAPKDLVTWAEGLGQTTFVGSSGRVFPKAMKASPLLRAWLARLADRGVIIRTRTEWFGWSKQGALRLRGADGAERPESPAATVLALGGASWPKLGSNGAWTPWLRKRGVLVEAFCPANMGINIAWTEGFWERFAGEPIKNAVLAVLHGTRRKYAPKTPSMVDLPLQTKFLTRGEAVVTSYGLEGGGAYALATTLGKKREMTFVPPGTMAYTGLEIDLRPDMDLDSLKTRLETTASDQSTPNILRKAIKLSPVAINLMREGHGKDLPRDPAALARAIKAVPLKVTGVQGLERAISSAGGVRLDQVDDHLMLTALPGTFVAGEMLDWSAPTGGYLLQACFATGAAAAHGALAWLARRQI